LHSCTGGAVSRPRICRNRKTREFCQVVANSLPMRHWVCAQDLSRVLAYCYYCHTHVCADREGVNTYGFMHRPLIGRSSTTHRPLIDHWEKPHRPLLLNIKKRVWRPILRLFDLEMRSMRYLLVVDEWSMSGRWAVDERSMHICGASRHRVDLWNVISSLPTSRHLDWTRVSQSSGV